MAEYKCSACGVVLTVDGEFRWFWQGKSHWHCGDLGEIDKLHRHWQEHQEKGEECAMFPVRDD